MKITSATLYAKLNVSGAPDSALPISTSWNHELAALLNLDGCNAMLELECQSSDALAIYHLDNFPAVQLNGTPIKGTAGTFLNFAKISGVLIVAAPTVGTVFANDVTLRRVNALGDQMDVVHSAAVMAAGVSVADAAPVDSTTEIRITLGAIANAKVRLIVVGVEADGYNYYS